MPGPPIRTDIVDVYVFRRPRPDRAADAQFLQLHRVPTVALANTWQPVMGHMLEGETAAQTALRELREETAYAPDAGLVGFWQLERLNSYFLHSHETVIMSPCFAVEVAADRDAVLNAEHDTLRWVRRDHVDRYFLWPGQRQAIDDILRDILEPGSPVEPYLRLPHAAI